MAKINLGKVRFEYDDFTSEQLLYLKGEKGEQGTPGKDGVDGITPDMSDFENQINEQYNTIINENNTFKNEMNEDFGNAKTDYFGKEHNNVVDRLNSDFDNVHQRINDSNYLEYSSSNITADNSYYGYTKELSIKGRTLQNLTKASAVHGSSTTFYFIDKSHEQRLKPNTKYTMVLYPSSPKINRVYLKQGTTRILDLNSKNMVLFTTIDNPNSVSEFIHFYTKSDVTLDEVKDTKIMLLEGNYTNIDFDIPYIEGIKSVGENDVTEEGQYPVNIKSYGKNLTEHTQQVCIKEPLRSLSNDIYDEIEGNKVIRRIHKLIVNGNERWIMVSNSQQDTTSFSVTPEIPFKKFAVALSDKFVYYANTNINSECFTVATDGKIHVRILRNKLKNVNAEGFKEWLSKNPLTIYYVLNEPIVTKHNKNMNLKTYDGTTHIVSTNTLPAIINCKVPSNVQAVVSNLKEENKALNTQVSNLNLENEKNKETNANQDELIDTTMLATDEMYMMLEPLLAETSSERSVSKMVDMYVAMVQRGIKTIEQVPVRYREQVKKMLDQLEK